MAAKKGKKTTRRVVKRPRRQPRAAPKKRAVVKRKPRRRPRLQKFPAAQGKTGKTAPVGYGRPPVEHQFAPGESGNPEGNVRRRSNLWVHFCRWLELSPAQLAAAARDRGLTMAERAALKQVQQLAKRGLAGTAWLATREAWARDEGKPTEHVRYEREGALTDEECEQIREAMKARGGP